MRALRSALLTLAAATPALADEWPVFEALPDGATEISEAEARALIDAGRLVPGPTDRIEAADDDRTLADFFARHPEAREAFEAIARTFEDGGPREITLETRGGPRTVTLTGLDGMQRELAGSLRQVNDRTTVLRTYAWLHRVATAAGRRLPSPDEAATLSTADIRMLNREILNQYKDFPRIEPQIDRQPAFPEASFDPAILEKRLCVGGQPANLGSGAGGDLEVFGPFDETCDVLPDGIIALDPRDYVHHLGCIKDQGNRGSCVGFAVASALETAFSYASQQLVDLSEQSLYARGKLREPMYDPNRDWDGLDTEETLQRLAQEQFTVSFESGWDYNPSHQRTQVASPTPAKYKDSCQGYSQTCSDFVHQARQVCFRQGAIRGLLCGFETQSSTWGLRIEQPGLQLWDAEDSTASVEAVKAALDSGHQVVLGVMVNNPFKGGVAGDGFVDYDGQNVDAKGWHALHVVAYVNNTELAEFAPNAPPGDYGKPGTKGEGGYFIVRNSWGPCAGDGGYLYLPYRWLKPYLFVTSAVAIAPGDVNPWMVEQ